MRRSASFLIAVTVSVFPFRALAIVIRHDRPDARYIALGQGHPEVCDVAGAAGTLIATDWVLTAGHVGEIISPYSSFVTISGKRYGADRVILHPEFVRNGVRSGRDFCLIHLAQRVAGVAPAQVYAGSKEAGMVVTFVGRGDTGDGRIGPTRQDGKIRGANNLLERVNDRSVFFTFDQPGKALDLEGISGPGDSGGPALVNLNGKLTIVGVSSANQSHGQPACTYGTTEVYARVSRVHDWIEHTMRTLPPSTMSWRRTLAGQGWPLSRAGEMAGALFDAFNQADAGAYEDFNQRYRLTDVLMSRTPQARAKAFNDYIALYGRLQVLEYAEPDQTKMCILARSSKTGRKVVITLFFDPSDPRGFDGWNIDPGP